MCTRLCLDGRLVLCRKECCRYLPRRKPSRGGRRCPGIWTPIGHSDGSIAPGLDQRRWNARGWLVESSWKFILMWEIAILSFYFWASIKIWMYFFLPVEELNHAAPFALLELLVELQEVAHSVVVVLLQHPLQLHLNLAGQLLVLPDGPQPQRRHGLRGPARQRQRVPDGPRSVRLPGFDEVGQGGATRAVVLHVPGNPMTGGR